MKRWFTRLWRRIWNRCELCGRKRIAFNVNDIHSWGPFCRFCNKVQNFGRAYGAGPKKLREMTERNLRSERITSTGKSLTMDDLRRTLAALPPSAARRTHQSLRTARPGVQDPAAAGASRAERSGGIRVGEPGGSVTFENLTAAKDACQERYIHTQTRGAQTLYHAVWELWWRTEAGPIPRNPPASTPAPPGA